MIDVHSHVLPGIDDGARNMDMSIQMLRKAEQEGTEAVVMTPHFCRGYGEASSVQVRELTERLKEQMKHEGISLELHPGQEVFLTDSTIRDLEQGIIMGINDTRYMLVELPMDEIPKHAMEVLYELRVRGMKPMLAHPERYAYVMKDVTVLNRFIEEGCLFQLNSGSIEGVFGKEVRNTAETLLKSGAYCFLGSDAHSTGRRTTGLREAAAIMEKLQKGSVDVMMENSRKMLKGEELNVKMNKLTRKKSIFNIFKF